MDAEIFGFLGETFSAFVGPAGVGDAAKGEASEALFDEMAESDFGDGIVVGMDKGERAVVVIAEDIDDGDAL